MGRYEQACFFALAIYSGRRKSELLLFKVPYFDDENIIYGSLYKTPEKIRTKGRGVNGKMLTCYVLAKPFKPYFDLWMKQREELGIESEWLFPDKEDPSNHIQVSTANSWADMYSRISGLNVYLHSLRHAFTTNLARAGLPDSVIQEILGWSDISMVQVYKDIDSEEEFGKYFVDGEIIGQKQTSLSEL